MMWRAGLCLVLCASLVSGQETYWPCPDPVPFAPCKCTVVDHELYIMDIDCSEAEDDNTLKTAFQVSMSFCTYQNLLIAGTESSEFDTFNLDTFGCASFENIEITGTNLQIIGDGTFSQSENSLTSLNIADNAITNFPFESLLEFTALEALYINKNFLTTVQRVSSPSLKILAIDDNPNLDISLGLFESVPLLETLTMENCNLNELPDDMFTSLEALITLDLSGNMFEELKPSSIGLPQDTLQNLDMSDNPLLYVRSGAISGLSYPDVSLSFEATKLVELDEDVWSPYFTPIADGMINIAGTPLRCGCDIAWLFTEDSLNSKLTDTTQCSDGSNLKELEKCVFQMHCNIQQTDDCRS